MSIEVRTIAGLFAGVGGIELGFKQAGFVPIVANELDAKAAKTYELTMGLTPVPGPIEKFDRSNNHLPEGLTILAGGFPCQPFSLAGYRKGFDDDRGNVFFQIVRLLKKREPRVVFLENVKNLETHDESRTFDRIRYELEKLGYHIKYRVINASEYSDIPQNRARIFIIGFLRPEDAANFEWPGKIEDLRPAEAFVDFENKSQIPAKYFYTDRVPFFEELTREVTQQGLFYQWRRQYVRVNKSGLCPTLTANMGTGGHNVPIILSAAGIRKLTPRECFNLMGNPDVVLDDAMADSHKYKQAGNSVVVPVVRRLAEHIRMALDKTDLGLSLDKTSGR
jgi:DNA (cytosine-5)-methyltransferase 1